MNSREVRNIAPNSLYSDIEEAVLFSMPWLIFTAYVLRIKSKGQIYQFGVNPGSFWKKELPFPVKREKAKENYWRIVNVIRIAILAFILYQIIKAILHRI